MLREASAPCSCFLTGPLTTPGGAPFRLRCLNGGGCFWMCHFFFVNSHGDLTAPRSNQSNLFK